MSETKQVLSNETIEKFLQGSDPQKHIVAVEAEYDKPFVKLVINDPESGKRIEEHKVQPFLWFKEEVKDILYGGKRMAILEACQKFDVKITALRTWNDEGHSPKRMENGYKFLAKTKRSYNDLILFFKYGGIDVFSKEHQKLFVMFSPTEQFLIQSGKRLFKGMDDYDDVHRLQFDLETEGLLPSRDAIFQIGVKDNKGNELVLDADGETPQQKRNAEREMLERFFKVIDIVKPDIITGYNSESFDWNFIFERAERLGMDVTELAITLNRLSKIKRKESTLKLGGETESYKQTHMYGYNILDVAHAVRRAMAINSEIKGWGLKYITQYSGIAKPNRVYLPGDKINTMWSDKVNAYAFNDNNGEWYRITEKNPLKEGFVEATGKYLVERYLQDDLWETEQIDYIFNQASFLIAKILPTSFMRSSTMGTAGQWKLIMSAWSYENGLAIPETQSKREFVGGLSRLLQVGFARNVVKLDFAALYPKTQLTWLIFPDLDITGVMKGLLTYVVDTRDHFKFLTGVEKKKAKKLQEKLDELKDTLSASEIKELKAQIAEHKRLSNLYDKKQLPLKILANSWFGSYGAPYIFNWGDTDSAEETTCRGRQSLRLMVRHFSGKYGFTPLVGDTDGFNFAFPDNVNEIKYIAKGNHWKTKDDAGKELTGLDAVLAEFNENYMEGRMGLDIDDICDSTINFARKNYANLIDGKIKLVGNSIKSKKMSVFIEDFLNKAIKLLLNGDGYSFIQEYQAYVDKIYNYQIPLVKIASKAKVKSSITDYKKKSQMKNKAGNPMPKQAHMELAIQNGMEINLGDTLYYVNTGTSKSTGDLKTVDKNKMKKKDREIYFAQHGVYPKVNKVAELNCRLIDPLIVERDFEALKELEMLKKSLVDLEDVQDQEYIQQVEARIEEINESLFVEDYNVARYLDSFNKKVKPLLVCFKPEIRDNILLDIVKIKNKETKTTTEKLKDRTIFLKGECELCSGVPYKAVDQDSYEELMTMEDKEIKFWVRVNKVPNYMESEEWERIRVDYEERMVKMKEDGVANEKALMDAYIRRLEIADLNLIVEKSIVPTNIFILADVLTDTEGNGWFVSRKWGEILCPITDLLKYEEEAIERDVYYKSIAPEFTEEQIEEKYQIWLDYVAEKKVLMGDSVELDIEVVADLDSGKIVEAVKTSFNNAIRETKVNEQKRRRIWLEDEDFDTELEMEEDEDGNLTRVDEILQLDDEVDDTVPEKPEEFYDETPPSDDGWLF